MKTHIVVKKIVNLSLRKLVLGLKFINHTICKNHKHIKTNPFCKTLFLLKISFPRHPPLLICYYNYFSGYPLCYYVIYLFYQTHPFVIMLFYQTSPFVNLFFIYFSRHPLVILLFIYFSRHPPLLYCSLFIFPDIPL